MVCYVIYDHAQTDGTLSYSDLIANIEKDYHIVKIPTVHLDSAIMKLMANGDVIKANNRLSLTTIKKSEIKKQNKHSADLELRLKETISRVLKEKIPLITENHLDLIVKNLSLVLGTAFANYGSVAAKAISDGVNGITELRNRPEFQEVYHTKILNVVPKSYHTELDKVFNQLFSDPPEEFSEYLFSMSQSYVYLEILNVDPELKKIQNISWAKKHIYLDTNTLLSLLFEQSVTHASIYTLIQQTKELGAQIFITEYTSKEYETVLQNQKNKFSTFKMKAKFAGVYDESYRDNQFLSTYVDQLTKNPKLSIDQFSKKYEEYDKLIKNQYEIDIEPIDKSIDLESEEASKLKVHIVNNAYHKGPDVVNHDLYNILRVRSIRKTESDETGPRAWILTTDYSLPRSERDMYSKKEIFASVTPEIWLQIISPFLSPTLTIKDRSTAFTKLLSSNFKSHKMRVDDLANLLTVFMDDSLFTSEQIKVIMGNDFIQEKLHAMKGSFEKGETITLEKFEPIMREAVREIKEDFDRKFAQADESNKKELGKMKNIIGDLEDNISQLKSKEEQFKSKEEQLKSKEEQLKLESESIKKLWMFRIIFVTCSAIFDSLMAFGLYSMPKFSLVNIAIIILVITGLESGLIHAIPKLYKRYQRRKETSRREPWNRIEKLTLIVIVIGGASLVAFMYSILK